MESDLFLLQELAELANRSSETPLILVGVLHQSFERYTGHADSLSQREWAKIQGRFEDIAFLEPPNQQLWLLANALEYKVDQEVLRFAWPNAASDVQYAFDHELHPSTLRRSEFSELCERILPFHPLAMVALPYLFRRLRRMNGRCFLSNFPGAAADFRSSSHNDTRLIESVWPICLTTWRQISREGCTRRFEHGRLPRRWTRLRRDPLLSRVAVDTLKTIGLLSLVGRSRTISGMAENILYALRRDKRSNEEIQQTLRQLQQRSTIVFRRFQRNLRYLAGQRRRY
jgi:hypothetical protein